MNSKNHLMNVNVRPTELGSLPRGKGRTLHTGFAFDTATQRLTEFIAAAYPVHGEGHLVRMFGNWSNFATSSQASLAGAYIFREWQTVNPCIAPSELLLAIDSSTVGQQPDYATAMLGSARGSAISFSSKFEHATNKDQWIPTIRLTYMRAQSEFTRGALELADMLTGQSMELALGARIVATDLGREKPWFDGSLGDFRRQCLAEPAGAAAMYHAPAADYSSVPQSVREIWGITES